MTSLVFNPYCIPVLVTAFFCILLALYVFKNKDARTAGHLLFILILAFVWCAAYVFELCFIDIEQKLMTVLIQYICIPSLPAVFALFVYRYTNPTVKCDNLFILHILFIIPFTATLLMFTNNIHHLMYTSCHITQIPNTVYTFLVPQYGPAFFVSTAYSYMLMVATFAYIIYISVKTTKFVSAQAIILFCCALIPIAANLMYFFKDTNQIYWDMTPVAFFFSLILMTYLVTGMKHYDLKPIARDMIIENTTDGTILLDSGNIVLDINPMVENMFSVSKKDVCGKNISGFFNMLPDNLAGQEYDLEIAREGKMYHLSVHPLVQSSMYAGQIIVIKDITKTKLAEKKVHHLAFFDTLTGLPNHAHMLQKLQVLLQNAKADGSQVTLLLISINNLNYINSFYGYPLGDALIKQFAEKVSPNITRASIFARMKSNEFIIAMPAGPAPQSNAVVVAEKIAGLFIKPVVVKDKTITTGVSIGICISEKNTQDINSLLQKASLALGQAKAFKANYMFYSVQKENEIAERNNLMHALLTALDNNEFYLEYQPQYNYKTHTLYGVEALLRWRHPTYGTVSPIKFINLLEDNGMIVPVGNWIISESAKQYKKWIDKNINIPKYSINLSVRQLDKDGLATHVLATLDQLNIPRHCLEVEVTETLAALADDSVVKQICKLSDAGIRIAIDDFGAGFSSLTYFKYLNVNTLKIDKELSIDIHKNKYSAAILESLKLLCDVLGVDIIAEYVETEEQIAKFLSLGCSKFQGHYFAVPLSPDALEQYAASLKG